MSDTPRQRQKRETRERILDSATSLMAGGRSFDSLGLREVAREAGLAATSLYNHFPDMEALGLALIDRACFRLRGGMAEGRRSMIEIGVARAVRELVGELQLLIDELAEDIRQVVASQGRPPVPAEREAEAAVALMFSLGVAMLDVSPARREQLARNAAEQLEILALGGRRWAAGERL